MVKSIIEKGPLLIVDRRRCLAQRLDMCFTFCCSTAIHNTCTSVHTLKVWVYNSENLVLICKQVLISCPNCVLG